MKKWLLFIFLILNMGLVRFSTVPFTPAVSDGFVGNNGTPDECGDQTGYPSNDKGIWDSFSATTSGQISYVHVYLQYAATASDYNVAIYDSSGTTKLADGTLQNAGSAATWYHFQLDTPINIVSGTTYILAIGSKTDDYYTQGDTYSGNGLSYDTSYDVENSMPASISADGTNANFNLSIYADNSAT